MLSAQLPVEQVAVASVGELDTNYWSDGTGTSRTVRQIVEHARLILDVDVEYPVIISWEGLVMDGMHRIARAVLEGRTHVPARQFAACRYRPTTSTSVRTSSPTNADRVGPGGFEPPLDGT